MKKSTTCKNIMMRERMVIMKNFIQNLANLVNVKTFVTFAVVLVFSVLALRGDITPDNVMVIATTVVAFYFGTQHEKKSDN